LIIVRALEHAALELRLPGRPGSAARLRERLRPWLGELGASDDEIFEMVIAVSEAFVNAVEHPRNPSLDRIDVEGRVVDHTVTVSVRDYGSWQHERLRPGGNGFLLMRMLMDAVEVDSWLGGTTVTLQRRLAGS
jgi:anti-sigma regulatory factor (Ser/Thr protein kinase)